MNRLYKLAWGVPVIFAAMDLLWLPFSRLHISPANAQYLVKSVLTLTLLAVTHRAIEKRLNSRPERHPLALVVRYLTDGLARLIPVAAFLLASTVTAGTFMYLGTSAGLPLQDAMLAAVDRRLGFDWLSFLAMTNSSKVVSTILIVAYHSTGPLLIVLFIHLSFARADERLAELMFLFAFTSLATGIGMALVPAAGAYISFQPTRDQFSNFTAQAGVWHYEAFLSLRGPDPVFDLTDVRGLVTFPSYHTVLAIIMTYVLRDRLYLFIPMAVLNGATVVSTLPEGGHHLVDVIVGSAIAAATIVVLRRVQQDRALSSASKAVFSVAAPCPVPGAIRS